MTIQTAFTKIISFLEPIHGQREAANIAHILMEHVTGMSKMDRIVYKDRTLEPSQESLLEKGIQELLEHRPIQYVTGSSWFYGMELGVDSNVLIPRPETEELVEWIVEDVRAGRQAGDKILDIGTGSGAIPIAIKKELPRTEVWGIDVSEGALEVAGANAVRQKKTVHFEKVDVLDVTATALLPSFDIIVSNPPYICQHEQENMQEQVVAHEPSIALFVPDNDALLFYRQIGWLAKQKLHEGGALYFEINEAYGQETVQLLREQGFRDVVLKQDLFGKDRMIKAMI